MKDYYRKLITELLPKINDEMKLHEVYVLTLKCADEECVAIINDAYYQGRLDESINRV